jgi:hypothetical protein
MHEHTTDKATLLGQSATPLGLKMTLRNKDLPASDSNKDSNSYSIVVFEENINQ